MKHISSRRLFMASTLRTAAAVALPMALPLVRAQEGTAVALDVPYVPTPQPVVDRMLQLARVGPDDVVYDLGCGDGRVVITAAKAYGARGIGIDIDPQRIAEARANAKRAGVTDKVEFRIGDLFEADFSEATVVTLYLLPSINQRLRPQLWRQLRVGARVVSHDFDMGSQWPPEHTENVANKTIYAWTITQANKDAAR
ncbi:methyltransferase domain-containing protein [Caldimonas thermodepolymerans]|jgi:SAM-dependent methyltransferase|uniref:SAM-dependent methyltransferase n=1 Tax=Caldimonas thermodepolymerans TaxID=215580 RepID=A0A2S5T9A5_9BURK|nr:class I SAM-dependent methyltransferase [Caldimonas thermodepolymerans]PPE71571.1 SAM-dependent methyltransferase [Caldimonas thermodepolymerans]QPC30596.1 methyltransferase domain-containing protein [Caldimonas thermodepolymerans]RDI02802.1 methyltransferase family protein [Caldimonas thermodepolymerans]UZG43327.1 class I SAM-dependent methyltransferase [Caldimonas thermodepolymerans]